MVGGGGGVVGGGVVGAVVVRAVVVRAVVVRAVVVRAVVVRAARAARVPDTLGEPRAQQHPQQHPQSLSCRTYACNLGIYRSRARAPSRHQLPRARAPSQ